MTTTSTTTRTAGDYWKLATLTAVLIAVELWAFSLSFEHHITTAIGAGYSPDLAPRYPLVIDGAIVAATLVLIWWPRLTTGQRAYIWFAIAIWTALSGANNAISILTSDTTTLGFPVEIAIAVNTVPTITQFLVLHIVYLALHSDHTRTTRKPTALTRLTAKLRPNGKTAQKLNTAINEQPRTPKPRAPRAASGASSSTRRRAQPEGLPTAAEMLERNESGETVEMIAETLNGARQKTWVHEQIRRERDRRESGEVAA